jgi:hypothetical protein
VVLAVDGGNSKTEAALVDRAGGVLGAARGPGASHHHLGVPAAMDTLEALVVAACHDAGLPPGVVLLLALLPEPVYDYYVEAPRLWGLTPLEDQQIAGGLMLAGGLNPDNVAQAIAKVRHPGIVQVHDFGTMAPKCRS